MTSMPDKPTIAMDQLRPGLYVELGLKWYEHPFPFNKFCIKTEEQIETIRSLGLKAIRYDPSRSEVDPRRLVPQREAPPSPVAEARVELSPVLAAKRAMIERIRVQREAAGRVERAFASTAGAVSNIEKNLLAKPEETLHQATQLIGQIAQSILSAPELAIHIMGEKLVGEEAYLHSLNVTILSLMLARDIKLPQEALGMLGMGALLHDVGRNEIPAKILMKTDPLTQAERSFYELHCQYGVDIGRRLKLTAGSLAIIGEHHEAFDGSGYPGKLKGESINLLSRIVAIANRYDELCNPANLAEALTPHEALSLMFARLRAKFDPKLLQVFVHCLGVYPPGTIVELSNGALGMVATVNTAHPMKPMVMVYDADIPKDEAILVDMEHETDANISKAIRPGQLPREIYNYLNPRKQVSYYFDAGSAGQGRAVK
jgi:putative nucleotidyltransferase with HDIG domain